MSIYFLGVNPYYGVVNSIVDTSADCIVCTSSEEELNTALLVEDRKVKGISINGALNCINRLRFRLALVGTGLNPRFSPACIEPGVLKLSTSVQNMGVHFLQNDTYTGIAEQMNTHFPELNNLGVWEEFVTGEHYEVSGFVINGEVNFRLPLKQTWSANKDKILKYEAISLDKLPLDKLLLAIERLDLDYTFFNFELIYSETLDWKLIEANTRLGEDARLDKDVLESLVNQFIEKYHG